MRSLDILDPSAVLGYSGQPGLLPGEAPTRERAVQLVRRSDRGFRAQVLSAYGH